MAIVKKLKAPCKKCGQMFERPTRKTVVCYNCSTARNKDWRLNHTTKEAKYEESIKIYLTTLEKNIIIEECKKLNLKPKEILLTAVKKMA